MKRLDLAMEIVYQRKLRLSLELEDSGSAGLRYQTLLIEDQLSFLIISSLS